MSAKYRRCRPMDKIALYETRGEERAKHKVVLFLQSSRWTKKQRERMGCWGKPIAEWLMTKEAKALIDGPDKVTCLTYQDCSQLRRDIETLGLPDDTKEWFLQRAAAAFAW